LRCPRSGIAGNYEFLLLEAIPSQGVMAVQAGSARDPEINSKRQSSGTRLCLPGDIRAGDGPYYRGLMIGGDINDEVLLAIDNDSLGGSAAETVKFNGRQAVNYSGTIEGIG